jgi:hypothetical protein
LAAAGAACLGYLLVERSLLGGESGFPLDDSWIHLAFARNLAAGHGLSLNPGDLVTGSTAPLWTALLSLVLLLPGSPLLWVKLIGAALHLAGGDAAYRLARELELGPGLAALAAGMGLATGWLIWAALSGLEIPLFVALSLWGVLLHLRERRQHDRLPLSMVVLATSALARPEGMLLLALAVVDRLLPADRSWRRILPGVALALLLLTPLAVFNLAVGDSPLPTTFVAKAGGSRDWLPGLQYLYAILRIFFSVQPWSVLLAAGGAVELLRRLGTSRDRGLLPALWLFGLPLAYAALSPRGQVVAGNFGRYYFPLYPFLAILGLLAVAPLVARLRVAVLAQPRRLALSAAAVTLLLAPTLLSTARGAGRYAQSVVNVQDSDVAMARWLASRLPPEAVLAVNDIGALGYLLPNRLIDLAGIANPELAAYAVDPEGREAGFQRFLAERRPDYLVVFPAWFPELVRTGGPFRPVYQLTIANNITMGGDLLVVYSTPWTRYPLASTP